MLFGMTSCNSTKDSTFADSSRSVVDMERKTVTLEKE